MKRSMFHHGRWRAVVKKSMGSFLLFIAVLAIANIDTLYRGERASSGVEAGEDMVRSRQRLKKSLLAGEVGAEKAAPSSADLLRDTLADDELNGRNPYASLTNLDPLKAVLSSGVVTFQREAYRSPQYQDESGYDIVAYEIRHPDQSTSKILAYADSPVTDPQKQQVVVMIFHSNHGYIKQYLFYDGLLSGASQITMAQAEALFSHKLGGGIPFFSVSR